MWPLPEPTRPDTVPDDDPRWDPPALVRLPLDHGCDTRIPAHPVRAAPRSREPGVGRRG